MSSSQGRTPGQLRDLAGTGQQRFFGEKLKLVREARGLSQPQLSKMAGLSQGWVSKIESGIHIPDSAQINQLADALDVLPSIFGRTDYIAGAGPGEIFHRKRSMGQKKLAIIHARMNLLTMMVRDLLESIEPPPVDIPESDREDLVDMEELAVALRAHWYVPDGPVASVSQVVGRAGVLLVPFDFAGEPIDGIGRWQVGELPIIFYNPSFPDDRLRFTIMHEVAHFCLHRSKTLAPLTKEIETEADRFASAFLMPEAQIRSSLRGLSITKLGSLKLVWKCSMGSIIQRAKQLETVSARTVDELWRQMSAFGYRTREPEQYDVHCEEPGRRFRQLIDLHLKDLNYTVTELGAMTGVKEHDARGMLALPSHAGLRVV